ncbi:hypothetical protein ANCCEY_12726 [Ancylostoma ceylanicum]|uniref:Uncharacterized protein n=1 Tax=Ancylostoma ceylanicum TaxID=53326 RepID=A0A0D6L926_9BILA|nr:hypothetical protein ANCCEY_12726 [Ancylostoma ceylanicum]
MLDLLSCDEPMTLEMVYPASVFITGANRGIGLGLVREFLKVSSVKNVIAGARNPDSAKTDGCWHGISGLE